jgi:hypothetical protein
MSRRCSSSSQQSSWCTRRTLSSNTCQRHSWCTGNDWRVVTGDGRGGVSPPRTEDEPVMEMYLPAAQSVQALAPVLDEYFPVSEPQRSERDGGDVSGRTGSTRGAGRRGSGAGVVACGSWWWMLRKSGAREGGTSRARGAGARRSGRVSASRAVRALSVPVSQSARGKMNARTHS